VKNPESAVLTVISGVEFVAMSTGRIPTWTSMWRRLPVPARRVLRPILVAGVAVWAWFHFD
jgi:hypothetical protein